MSGMQRPICAHCGATMPKDAGECQVRPDLSISRRVHVSWEEDGDTVRASFPEQCLVPDEDAVGAIAPVDLDRMH